MIIPVASESAMKKLGARLGALLRGGEVIELVGDVGAGKTTLTKGIAAGLDVDEDVQSPSFTISRVYEARDDLMVSHYDFYRLHDAGILEAELHEVLYNKHMVTIVEWADVVSGVLPADRLTVHITSPAEMLRDVEIKAGGSKSKALLKELA